MKKIYLLLLLIIFTLCNALAQDTLLREPLLAAKIRYLLFTYGAGAEFYFNSNNSLQIQGVMNYLFYTPSIDPNAEKAFIIEYRNYVKTNVKTKPKRTYLAPYYKYSDIEPGLGKVDHGEWFPHVYKDHNIGTVIGRQLFIGRNNKGYLDFFIGPQLGYRYSIEKIITTTGETLFRKREKCIYGIRAGMDLGLLFYKRSK